MKLSKQHTAVAAAWWIGKLATGFVPDAPAEAAESAQGWAALGLKPPNRADDKGSRARAVDDLEWAAREHPRLINDDAAMMAAAAHRPGGVGCPFCDPELMQEGTAS